MVFVCGGGLGMGWRVCEMFAMYYRSPYLAGTEVQCNAMYCNVVQCIAAALAGIQVQGQRGTLCGQVTAR